MESIRLKARAKINLGLDVLRKREDGYHDVRMVMQTIGIYDRLIITRIPEEDIRIKSNLFFLPVNENNLIYKAAKLLKDRFDFAGGVEIDLNKFIPVSAGLAGGSTDAASTLFGINRLFDLGLSTKDLMELGVLGATIGLLSYGIAKWILVPCGWILWGYEKLCRLFIGLPGAQYITGKPDMWQMLAYYMGLVGILFVLYRKSQLAEAQLAKQQYGKLQFTNNSDAGKMNICKRIKQWLAGAVHIFVPLAMLFLVLVWPQKKSFEIDFLDVGQGDGIYLCTGNGVAMFVDGGSTDIKNVGQYRILPFLKAKGVRKISCWFVSHTDADHISGLEEVFASGYPVERLLFAEAVKNKEKTKSLAKLAEKAGTVVQYMEAEETLYIKNATIRCLYPQAMVQSEDINEQCLVLCYEESGVKALFAGDISSEIEKEILERACVEHVQIYKANHHGSRFSNGEEWMQALCPQITVASAGKNNRYGHPSAEACDRIRASGSAFYCTTEYGRIRVRIVDGKLICDGYVTAP